MRHHVAHGSFPCLTNNLKVFRFPGPLRRGRYIRRMRAIEAIYGAQHAHRVSLRIARLLGGRPVPQAERAQVLASLCNVGRPSPAKRLRRPPR